MRTSAKSTLFIISLFFLACNNPEPPSQPPTAADHLQIAKHLLSKSRIKYDWQSTSREDLREARKHLLQITPTDLESKEAKGLLKQITVKLKKIYAKEQKEEKIRVIKLREQYADHIERKLLKEGFDIYVTVYGRKKTTMKLKYIFMSRPLVYQLQETGFMKSLKKKGFKKVILTDGYDATWTYDLTE